jgi:hypothetical protein
VAKPKEITYSDLLDEFKHWLGYPTGVVGFERLLKALMEAGSIETARQVIGEFLDAPTVDDDGRNRCPNATEIRERIAVVRARRTVASTDCPECGGSGWRMVTRETPGAIFRTCRNASPTYQAATPCSCRAPRAVSA